MVNRRLAIPIFFIVSLSYFIIYGLIWNNAPYTTNDTSGYLKIAKAFADGKMPEYPDRTIGYPLILMLTGSIDSPNRFLFYFQLGLHLFSLIIAAFLLKKLGVSNFIIFIFIIVGILPFYVEPAIMALSETPTTFCLIAGISYLIFYIIDGNKIKIFLAAIFLSLSAYLRPTYQLLPLIIAAILFLITIKQKSEMTSTTKRLNTSCKIIILAFFVIVGGLSFFNYITYSYFGLTARLGVHLTTKTVSFFERLPDNYAIERAILIKHRDRQLTKPFSSHTGTQTIYNALNDLKTSTGYNDLNLYKHLLKMNLDLIKLAPGSYLLEVLRCLPTYWFPYINHSTFGSKIIQFIGAALHFVIVILFFLFSLLISSLSFFYYFYGLNKKQSIKAYWVNEKPLILTVLFLFFTITYTYIISIAIDVGDPRQRTPTDILILMFNSIAIHFVISSRKIFKFTN